MIRKASLFAALLLCLTQAFAQVGNEWINFSQSYYKIPVAKSGLYKLTYQDLQNAGFPVNANPQQFQLFHRGVEQSINVIGEQDGTFNTNDFIEFYGIRNDGTLDAELYNPSSAQPHRYYNLYSDTTSYYLTLSGTAGKRMVISNASSSGLTSEPYHFDEKLLIVTDEYSRGTGFSNEVFASSFETGEGWTGFQTTKGNQINYVLSGIINTVTTGPIPKLEMLLVGRGDMQHQADIYGGSSNRLLATANFSSFDTYKLQVDLNWSDISASGDLAVQVRVTGVGATDRLSVSYIKLTYAQQTNAVAATEKSFKLAEQSGGKSLLTITNAPNNVKLFDITNPDAVSALTTSGSSTVTAVATSTQQSRTLFATSTYNAASIKKVTFRQIIPSQHNYIIITHPLLRKPALGYTDPVKAYAEYRSTEEGGKYDTLVVNIQQLYDQFNYGETSPLAIFHFMKFLSAVKAPQYLFLIGKGIDLTYKYYRTNTDSWAYKDLVPTSGNPGSDMFFTAGLNNTTYEPAVATGRLTAMKPEQVAAYLNKVKEMESKPYDDLWRKNILHLSGGREEGEPEAFKSYLEDYGAIAEDYYLGGHVSAIAKKSREIQVINIAKEINNGVNLVTFFGHSNPSVTDFDIGFVTNEVMGYNNAGKYPMLIMNGCEAGAFFLTDFLFGEDWISADKKGAIGFIAHTSYGLVYPLKRYTQTIYKIGYGSPDFITKGIGDIQKETARQFMNDNGASVITLAQIQQMILLGDPAAKLFGAPKPDYEVNTNNISLQSFTSGGVTAAADSFALKFVVRNFGQAVPGKMQVQVTRKFSDNTLVTYDSLYESPKYSDTLTFVVPNEKGKGSGSNTFTVTIDADKLIDEISKENNQASLNIIVVQKGTRNLFPSNFAIVNNQNLNLVFQNADLLAGNREFMVELDTTDTFDSPFKKQFTISGTVLSKQAIELLGRDSTAYYWRTKFSVPTGDETDSWDVTSFTYIKDGEEGWAQVHFPQYGSNSMSGLIADQSLRQITFKETTTKVDIITYNAGQTLPVSVKIDEAEFNLYTFGNGCRNNTINLIAFDRNSTVPYAAVYFKWYNSGARGCGREPWVINSFKSTELVTGNNDDIIAYIDNVAPGDSVILFTIGDAAFSAWPAQAKSKLSELGISTSQIDALQPGEAVVILTKKGAAAGAAKFISTNNPNLSDPLTVNTTISGGYSAGSMASPLIGPAHDWSYLSFSANEKEQNDIVVFNVIGVNIEGEQTVLLTHVTTPRDLVFVDATAYPYLIIQFNANDEGNLTPAQLRNWFVTYTPVPEGLLLFDDVNTRNLQEGENIGERYRFVNISEKTFSDSLTVNFDIFNQLDRFSRKKTFKIKSPQPGDTTFFSTPINSLGLDGLNDVEVFVNPKLLVEQYYDNNSISLFSHINVNGDNIAPVLDVTVDGRYIHHDEYISPSPVIIGRLIDENKLLLKTDTTGLKIFMTYPCNEDQCSAVPVYFSNANVKWYSATDTSSFRFVYTPQNLADGKYTLRVEGSDVKGNLSGVLPHEISFQVKNETTLIFNSPYPNPFSNQLNFNMTITGAITPDFFEFTIVDVNGRLVKNERSITNSFFIGENSFSWYGTDDQGNALPSGLYIYNLKIRLDNQTFQQKGKVVLSR